MIDSDSFHWVPHTHTQPHIDTHTTTHRHTHTAYHPALTDWCPLIRRRMVSPVAHVTQNTLLMIYDGWIYYRHIHGWGTSGWSTPSRRDPSEHQTGWAKTNSGDGDPCPCLNRDVLLSTNVKSCRLKQQGPGEARLEAEMEIIVYFTSQLSLWKSDVSDLLFVINAIFYAIGIPFNQL